MSDKKEIYQGHNDFIETEVKYQGEFEQNIDKYNEAYTYQGGNDFIREEDNFTGWI